jgi:hypothetical protein
MLLLTQRNIPTIVIREQLRKGTIIDILREQININKGVHLMRKGIYSTTLYTA